MRYNKKEYKFSSWIRPALQALQHVLFFQVDFCLILQLSNASVCTLSLNPHREDLSEKDFFTLGHIKRFSSLILFINEKMKFIIYHFKRISISAILVYVSNYYSILLVTITSKNCIVLWMYQTIEKWPRCYSETLGRICISSLYNWSLSQKSDRMEGEIVRLQL